MSFEQIVEVPLSGQLTIQIPASFKNRRKVKLIIDEVEDTLENKISLMQKAPQDEGFLFDLKEVTKDFEFSDYSIKE